MNTKSYWFLIAAALLVTACDPKHHGVSEPPAEVLEEELRDTPRAADGKIKAGTSVSVTSNFTCLGDRLDQDLSEFGYEVVVIIDKAKDGQTLRVLRRGRELYNWLTSTGAETPKKTELGHVSQRRTPTGFFRPTEGRLYENYFSRTWKAEMPYSIFFNGGIAIHATHESLYPLLGQRASGGCVRLTLQNAYTLFSLVRDEAKRGQVARFNRAGCLVKDRSGKLQYDLGYRTLIVVVDSSQGR